VTLVERTLKVLLHCSLLLPLKIFLQGYSYIDEAGNIYFVDRIDKIPQQYRHQVLKPTPTLNPTQLYRLKKQKPKKVIKNATKTPTPKGFKTKRTSKTTPKN